MGLPVSSRLRSSGEFALVRKKGTTFPGKFLVLSVLTPDALSQTEDQGESNIGTMDCNGETNLPSAPHPQTPSPTRYGFITTKKVGNAVTRNRLRRQLREIARLNPLLPGHWVVTILRWRAAQASFEELRQDWLRAAKRARLLPKSRPGSGFLPQGSASNTTCDAEASSPHQSTELTS